MALEKRKISDIPSDAIMLTEDEALKYHYKILNNWKDQSDILGYKYGSVLLSTAAFLSGVYINSHFRTKLKLFNYGRISSYLPVCGVPAAMTFALHHEVVLKHLVLLKQEHCPICIELRASAIQSFFGLLLPLVLGPVGSFGLASKYVTYKVPHVAHEPLQVLKLACKLGQPIKNILFGIFIGQAFLGSAVTYWEAQSIYKVHHKLNELQKDLEYSQKK